MAGGDLQTTRSVRNKNNAMRKGATPKKKGRPPKKSHWKKR